MTSIRLRLTHTQGIVDQKPLRFKSERAENGCGWGHTRPFKGIFSSNSTSISTSTSTSKPWRRRTPAQGAARVHPNPAQPRSTNSKKTQDSKGFRLKPFGPVWAAAQGLDLKRF